MDTHPSLLAGGGPAPAAPLSVAPARDELPEIPPVNVTRQHIRTVFLDVEPASAKQLEQLARDLRARQEATEPEYDSLRRAAPSLHFMAITVFHDPHFDPLLAIEVNFDGSEGPFWAEFEAALGDELRAMLRCCATPPGPAGECFAAIVANDSRHPIAPLLEQCAEHPITWHQGSRGMARARIQEEGRLFNAAQRELGSGLAAKSEGLTPAQLHGKLRKALLPEFPWLEAAAPPLISAGEGLADWGRLGAFGVAVGAALAAPAFLLGLLVPPGPLALVLTLLVLVLAWRLDVLRDWLAPGAILLAVAAVGGVSLLLHLLWPPLATLVPGALVSLLAVGHWLRRLERRDHHHRVPPLDAERQLAMARLEDQVIQNHMGSILVIRPGVLRAVLLRTAFLGLGLAIRIWSRDGSLGQMRTIHFAHWALANNRSRLVFLSNFDGSWDSYLDDFIEKAGGGTSLAWGNCVGSPPARLLWFGGARKGRLFKAWARHSMTEALFWFSAYPDWNVARITRHAAVANGLRARKLKDKEASEWAMHL